MVQSSFSGSYDHSLDGKGRVIIPASYRDALGDHFTITINPNKTAIAVYPCEVWEQQLERLSKIDPMDKVGMQYVRYVMSVSFTDNSMDNQGRVLVPAKLRTKIGLTKDIVFVGMNNYIEIWDAAQFSDVDNKTEDEFDFVSDYVYKTYQQNA
ncbi:MAG: division/cell wall cluster transcriptional repressor MraZ [Clostridia bacterium]|nr:division/cell wall cluster transcriptional repressor MraZ [Clostridia bacterium]